MKIILSLGISFIIFLLPGVNPILPDKKVNSKYQENALVIKNTPFSKEFVLVTDSNITPRTKAAILDFQLYLFKVTGQFAQIVNKRPNDKYKIYFWIGNNPELKKIFPNFNFRLKQEEIIVLSNSRDIAIFGDDGVGNKFQNVTVGRYNREILDYQPAFGTINAIYYFLQEYLDIRWLYPGSSGEDIIEKRGLTFAKFEYRYSPIFKARSGLFYHSGLGRNAKENELDEWCKRQRNFYSSEYFNNGHAFTHWWDNYSNSYPEIFALNKKYNRNPLQYGHNVKLCISNNDIPQLWLSDVEKELSKNPFASNFNGNENDSYFQGWCICEKCKQIDGLDNAIELELLSNRHIYLVNEFAKKLKAQYPSNYNFRVLYFDYGLDRKLPTNYTLDTLVRTISVSNFHLNRVQNIKQMEPTVKEYYEWSKISSSIYWRPNIGNPSGLIWGLPDISFHGSSEDFKFVADNKCRGLHFDGLPNHWATQGPYYYLLAQLAWNPYLNEDSVLNDYYKRCYGPASGMMKNYWNILEKTRMQHVIRFKPKSASYMLPLTYDEKLFKNLFFLLNEAKKIFRNDTNNKYFKRISFNESGLQFAQTIVIIRKEMMEYEISHSGESYNRVKQLWKKIAQLKESMDPLAINFEYILSSNPNQLSSKSYRKRMKGLIIESPLTKKDKMGRQMEME